MCVREREAHAQQQSACAGLRQLCNALEQVCVCVHSYFMSSCNSPCYVMLISSHLYVVVWVQVAHTGDVTAYCIVYYYYYNMCAMLRHALQQ
jgi:hypothetical protein